MKVRYIGIYRLFGLNKLIGDVQTEEFLMLSNPDASVKLTINPEPFCFHLDRASAIRVQLLKGLFGPDKEDALEERLAAQIEEIRTDRQRRNTAGVFLIFDGTDDVISPNFEFRRDTDEFAVCFDAFAKGEVREKFRPALYGVLTAISLALPERSDSRIEKIGDVAYLVEPDGKVVYSFTPEMGTVNISLSTPLSEDAMGRARERAQAFLVVSILAKVANLLIESQETKTDELQAFIAVWSGLEIFITATFKFVYEDH